MRIQTGYTFYFSLHRTVSIVNPKSMSVGLYSHGTNVQNALLHTAQCVVAVCTRKYVLPPKNGYKINLILD